MLVGFMPGVPGVPGGVGGQHEPLTRLRAVVEAPGRGERPAPRSWRYCGGGVRPELRVTERAPAWDGQRELRDTGFKGADRG